MSITVKAASTCLHTKPLLARRTIDVPFPTPRLASVALKAIQVDKELSPLVTRTLKIDHEASPEGNLLRVAYKATTNRMLRVAVNSFMESLNLVLEVMEQLDEDVLAAQDPAQ
ncbi:CTAG/Pcc1 family [Xylariaceae sp. FL0016]|nr:CTAG/Pcc1 family [Xylariaceae sp. FL0016]